MRRGAERQADQGGRCLSGASLARPRLTRAPQVARSAAEGRRHQGRLLFAYFLLAKQEKVSRPPRRQSGTGTEQRPWCVIRAKGFDTQPDPSIPQPERWESNPESGVFGVGAQIPRAFGPPFGCCASLRSEIVIRPPKPVCPPFL
jgi:hypothetical protein